MFSIKINSMYCQRFAGGNFILHSLLFFYSFPCSHLMACLILLQLCFCFTDLMKLCHRINFRKNEKSSIGAFKKGRLGNHPTKHP